MRSLARITFFTLLSFLYFTLVESLIADTEKIEAPKPKPVADKKFWFTMSVLGASKTADGITSARGGPSCYDMNPILGSHPSDARYAGYFAATYAIEMGTAYLLKRYGQHHRWARHLWLIEPARQTTLHIRWSAHNAGLNCR